MASSGTHTVLEISSSRLDRRGASSAHERAVENRAANLAALQLAQPQLAQRLASIELTVEWVFGRDGFLTARTAAGWWAGCSVPLLAGRDLLHTLNLTGNVGCFLRPDHAGQLRACLDKIARNQAIIAVVPDHDGLAVILSGDNFSSHIRDRRLLFAAGLTWGEELAKIFVDFPGLPMPQQFVRTAILSDGDLGLFSTEAQDIIAAEMNRRSEQIALMRDIEETRSFRQGRIAVVAGSRLQLWNAAGPALGMALCQEQDDAFSRIDPDKPCEASPLAVAIAASQADAIIAADVFRADFPHLVADRLAWITWVTSPRIASPDPKCPNDGLLLADPSWRGPALTAGWSENRIAIATWPQMLATRVQDTKAGAIGLAVDTVALEVPQRVKDYSSQLLLWEFIENELGEKPFSLGNDPQRYLRKRREKMGISPDGFDANLFLERLISPAYHQGLARWMIRGGFAVALMGTGWDKLDEFSRLARGSAPSLKDLEAKLGDCAALVHPSPLEWAHAVEALGIPVLQPGNCSALQFAGNLREMVRCEGGVNLCGSPPISRGRVLGMIPGMRWDCGRPDFEDRSAD
jgi:hypothetical protein